jgi:glycosyltransferase involved in cell wall biosynthesis
MAFVGRLEPEHKGLDLLFRALSRPAWGAREYRLNLYGPGRSALDRLRADRTCFVIAHRLSTVRTADLICVMDEGRIVERGDHAGLVAAGGLYATLCRASLRDG